MLRLRKSHVPAGLPGAGGALGARAGWRRSAGLFDHYLEHPDEVPGAAGAAERGDDEVTRAVDYVAG